MTNPNPHKITDDQRGHRPRVDPDYPTKTYGIQLPLPLHDYVKSIGADAVRDIIKQHKCKNSQK